MSGTRTHASQVPREGTPWVSWWIGLTPLPDAPHHMPRPQPCKAPMRLEEPTVRDQHVRPRQRHPCRKLGKASPKCLMVQGAAGQPEANRDKWAELMLPARLPHHGLLL